MHNNIIMIIKIEYYIIIDNIFIALIYNPMF